MLQAYSSGFKTETCGAPGFGVDALAEAQAVTTKPNTIKDTIKNIRFISFSYGNYELRIAHVPVGEKFPRRAYLIVTIRSMNSNSLLEAPRAESDRLRFEFA